MKSWHRMVLAAGVAAAVSLWADGAYAAGRTQTRAGGGGKGTVTRLQLRDGSCLTGTATARAKSAATGRGTCQRLRDGSCLVVK